MILYLILREGWAKLSLTRNRLLFSTSVLDIFSSVALGLSIIPTPQETECSIGMGNLSTCATQGFFIQLSLAVPAYNAMLSLYYMLTIRYGMLQATIAKKYEPFMHAFALVPTLATAIIGVANKMFYSESAVCWIGDICQSNGNCPNGNVWGTGYGVAVASICFTCVCAITTVICMLAIFFTLRQRNLAMLGYSFGRGSDSHSGNRRMNDVEFAAVESAKQAYLYATAYILTYSGASCDLIASNISGSTIAFPFWFHFHVVAIFLPLQGMWNFFAYTRPIVSKIRRDRSDDISYIDAIIMMMSGTNGNSNSNQDLNTTDHSSYQHGSSVRRDSIFLMPVQDN